MASTWIALLRAVNLGARNKVPMAGLRQLFEEVGAEDVRTYIQSGNVVFAHPKPDREPLEAAVANAFGVKTVIVLRTAAQMKKLAASHPFGADTSNSHVTFLLEKPDGAALRKLAEVATGDQFKVIASDIALHYPNGYQGATLTAAKLEKLLGVPGTGRNWRTVAKLAELAEIVG